MAHTPHLVFRVFVILALSLGGLSLTAPSSADTGCPTAEAPPLVGSTYEVSTVAHLMWIKEGNTLANVARLGYSYVMTQDINMAGCVWSSAIADGAGNGNCTGGAGCFSGTFNGGGFSLRNFTLTATVSGSDSAWLGVFGDVVGGTIRDLNVQSAITVTSTSSGTIAVGAVTGYTAIGASIINVTSSGSLTVTARDTVYAGGVIGYCSANTGTYSDLTSAVVVDALSTGSSEYVYVGGVCGYQYATLTGASNTGSVEGQGDIVYVGGISGNVSTGGPIVRGTNSGAITGQSTYSAFVGGVAGNYQEASAFHASTSSGSVTITGAGTAYAGGLAGYTYAPVSDSSATGAVSASSITSGAYVGGLVGNQTKLISGSYATGAVQVTHAGSSAVYAGGLSGDSYSSNTVASLVDSYATGSVTVTSSTNQVYAGGLAGYQPNDTTGSFASGNVTATTTANVYNAYAGGLFGNAASNDIDDSYALGNVTASSGTGDAYSGGLVGSGSGTYTNTYAVGTVSATASGTAYAAGSVPGTAVLVNSFCVSTVAAACSSAVSAADRGLISTLTELKEFALFNAAGWSITDGYSSSTTWGICPRANSGLPFLTALQSANPCVAPDPEQVPPSWHQSLMRFSPDSECPTGWSPSWAQWPNDGSGGFVCNREIYYDINTGGWLMRSGTLLT